MAHPPHTVPPGDPPRMPKDRLQGQGVNCLGRRKGKQNPGHLQVEKTHAYERGVQKSVHPRSAEGQVGEKRWKASSCVWLFATPGIVAHQAPLSRGFSRQEYWSG